ncbi:MAG: TonB-dependent receptor [Muribaculaceae bacterium]|nr:TonB-dependent receptor [Muribaculaceae bacterium]
MKKIFMLLALIVMSATVVMRAESSAQHHGHNHNHKHDHRQGNSIYGHVIDDVTEDDIAYAAVLIVETGQGLNTDEYGKFQFNHIPEGEYTLRVQLIGYHTQELKVKVSKDVPLDVHVKMPVEGLLTEEVVVSASRNAVRRCEAPVVVNVLNTKTFEQTNSTDLAKSLNYQSGLRVENSCQNCAFPQVRINGLEGPYSQILINSRPVVSALSGVYGLEQIPVNMIDRVEVVRGGGSALFGANAVGGTINIITKEPVQNSFSASSTLSCMDGDAWEQVVNANASLVSSDGTYGIALYESYRNRNPYDRDGDSFSEVGKLNANTFGLNAYYKPSHYGKLNVEYHTTNEFRRGGNKFDLEPFQSDITEQTKHIINSGGVSYDQFFNEYKHKMSIYGSVQHIDRNSYYGAQQNPDAYGKTDDITWVAGGMYVGNYDKCLFAPATFTAGVEYQNNSMHDVMIGYNRDMKQDVEIFGGFLQNEWKMRLFTLLAGFRIDNHNLIDNPIFSPRVNLMYKPSDKFQTRLTWSTGFRAPQAYDEDLHITAVGGEGTLIYLADGLKPEKSNSFSGSIDWVFNVGHWQANVLLEGFYTDLRDVFILETVGHDEQGNMLQERRNGSGARVYGANLDFKIAHGNDIALQLGFTAQRSRYKEYEYWSENEEVAPTKNMMRTPDYYGYFTLSGSPFKNFDWSLSGIYTGKMHVPHFAPDFSEIPADYPYSYIENDILEHTPSFFDLNVKLNYTFILKDHLKLQVNAGIQNILDEFQKDLDKGGYRDSGYFYGPTAPRTFFVGFKIFN